MAICPASSTGPTWL